MTGPRGEALVDHFRQDVIGGLGAFAIAVEQEHAFVDALIRKLILEIAWVVCGDANLPPPLPPPRSSPSAPEPTLQRKRRAVALATRACLREADAASRWCVTEGITTAVDAQV